MPFCLLIHNLIHFLFTELLLAFERRDRQRRLLSDLFDPLSIQTRLFDFLLDVEVLSLILLL